MSRIFGLSALLAMALTILPARGALANVVTPTMNFTENTIATLSMHDPTINCDMVAEYNGVYIKSVVYSDVPSGSSPSLQSYLYCEDGYGHTSTISLAAGSVHPDVAMACRDSSGFLVYQAVVTYTVGTELYVEVYNLKNVGYSSFAIAPTPTRHEVPSGACNWFPHIDMWADYGANVPFLIDRCSMHQFAVVFSETSAGNLRAYVNDVSSWNASATAFTIFEQPNPTKRVHNVVAPDVACQMDANYSPVFHVAWAGVPSGGPYYQSAGGTGLYDLTYSYSGTATASGPNLRWNVSCYAPRIEAPGVFIPSSGSDPDYQIVFSSKAYASGYDQVLSWNPLFTADKPSQQDFYAPYGCMSACVAAGAAINNSLYPNIGNVQYTVGFYPWGKLGSGTPSPYNHVYERQIDYSTGTFFNTNTFQASTTPVNFYWDLNRNMAISNTSNYGADILSVWYNGTDLVWKQSTPDVMAFRPAGIANNDAKGNITVAPVPATDALRISGLDKATSYIVTDMAGRSVLQGITGKTSTVNVAALPEGKYLLRLAEAGRNPEPFSFIKQ